MSAVHPITGKPIRIMRTQTQLWRDAKTVVLLNETADPTVPWGRWETIAFGLLTVRKLEGKGIPIHVPVFTTDDVATKDDLINYGKKSHMIVVTTALMKRVDPDLELSKKIGNILCLDEFLHLFPYIEKAWTGTPEDAAILLCIILHYSRIAGVSDAAIAARGGRLESMKITSIGVSAKPPALWLIQQFYMPEKLQRRREINRCLAENVACPYIDKIVLLNEDNFFDQFPEDPKEKILQRVTGKRLTYETVLRFIVDEVPEDTIVAFANSDIFFEASTRYLWSLDLKDRFLALLRWDVQKDGAPSEIFGPRDDSQDTWICWSTSIKERKWKWAEFQFPFGQGGCDNAIAMEMLRAKFLVINPAYSIQTQHVHASGVRTYDPLAIVEKPAFLYISPTGLNDTQAIDKWSGTATTIVAHTPFDRPLKGVQETELKTFCSMIKRSDEYVYLTESQNSYLPPSETILNLTDCFITPTGFPYGHHELYIGTSRRANEVWSKTVIGGCQPVLEVGTVVAAPLTEKETATPETFCMRYLSKILQLRTADSEFLCPKDESFIDVLRLFRWSKREVPVLPQEAEIGIYCKKAIVWACTDETRVTAKDIRALRDNLNQPWVTTVAVKKKITIVEDGVLIDAKWIAELEEVLGDDFDVNVIWPNRSSIERIHMLLRTTETFIFGNSEMAKQLWSWMWLLPTAARVIELQDEMDPQGDGLHLAGACGANHSLVIVRRGLRDYMIKDSVKVVAETMERRVKTVQPVLPIIWLPRGAIQGFFGHSGDSFREMARMWAERGYCQVKEHPTAVNCWWGEVGTGCLLYDRPNLDWLWNAPTAEQGWKNGLFGNPEPPTGGKPWSFWPRRPALVEELAAQPSLGYEERTQSVVFYGRIENQTQASRRTGAWAAVCSDFYMPNGADKQYRFTQKEYLERLALARFGLCLAGFGRKCHREIECMAMGCVPIVDKKVDMSFYANPPVEGVHYLRVNGPEEVAAKIAFAQHDAAAWATMSYACKKWWKENASCEGFFALTKRLVAP